MLFKPLSRHLRVGAALATIILLTLPGAPALAQGTSTTQIQIDSPTANATLTNGTQTDIGGWAVSPGGSGSGVDTVRVYLDTTMESSTSMVGTADLGVYRPDVASVLRNPAYTYAGYNMLWTPSGISPGQHTLYVYAHSPSGWTYKTVSITMQAAPVTSEQRPYGQVYPSDYYMTRRYGYPGYYGGIYGGYQGAYGDMYGGYPGSYGDMYGGYPGSYYGPCQGVYGGACGGLFPPDYPYSTYPPRYPGQPCIMIYPPPPGC